MTNLVALPPHFWPKSGPLRELQRECEEVAETHPSDTHKMASLLTQMSLNYYQDVRHQAQQSFFSAMSAAVVGTLFFLYAAWVTMNSPEQRNGAFISLIAGGLIQVISGINFFLYNRAASQFAMFHICLERTNRFLLANTLCENLDDPKQKDAMRGELIRVVALAPMLSFHPPAQDNPEMKPHAPSQEHSRAETGVQG